MSILFFLSLTLLIYTFVGYPAILKLVKSEKTSPPIKDEKLPELTVLLCIYNSANQLASRIENILASDYPSAKLNILVVSDGSTDNPERIIDKLNTPQITLLQYPENKGKSYALSYAFQHVSTEYIAFTDVRQSFKSDALKLLAHNLSSEKIGAVSGNLVITSKANNEETGLYWKYEKSIRQKESDLNSLLGVTGAIYMAKTKLLPNLPHDSLLDDMYIPLSMVQQGYKIKFCEQAIAYDKASGTIEEEFTRKVRTLAGNYQLIKQMPWLLSPKKNPLFFQFLSHKIARLIMPFALISLFVSSFYLDSPTQPIFITTQIVFYVYTLLGYLTKNSNTQLPLINTCISFCSLNLAALLACWKYLTVKDITSLWKKH
ncbi:glycosyltransferase [Thalassotalea sp. G2M2-11]|uniref:glycosyltransferase n=1 Tax=Thalassotalea sp. G2M2-11 TaxID=2787627 RepID=UPI0019CF8F7A|nr:glycosyltransferase [Thalassotalea sp. G2M2-11]